MNKVAELTIEQYRKLVGQKVNDDVYFNPTVMPSGRFFISEYEINTYSGDEFAFIKDLPLIDFDSSVPDTTPPTETGFGIVIPQKYIDAGLFPDPTFDLNGYSIPLVSYNGGLAVDLAYLGWLGFRAEQDYKYNERLNKSFSQLWYELLGKYQNNEIIQL